jgi:hypothetical protein
MRALSVSPLSDYGVWWSLGDSKYGGTALLVKHSCSPISISYSLDQSGTSVTYIGGLPITVMFYLSFGVALWFLIICTLVHVQSPNLFTIE